MFWKAIVELGLIDEFFREIKSKLDVLKHNLIKNYVPFEGKFLSILDCRSPSLFIIYKFCNYNMRLTVGQYEAASGLPHTVSKVTELLICRTV